MASFATLPIELKLYIGEFLLPRDHYRYAASCCTLWHLSCNLVARRRTIIEYWLLSLDQKKSENNARIQELYEDTSLLDLVTAVLLKAANEPTLDPLLLGYDRALPALTERELDSILVEVLEAVTHEQRLAIFDRLKKHGCPKTFFPLFMRNVEFFMFSSNAGVRQMLTQVYQPVHYHLFLPFPKLSHIRIEHHFIGELLTTLFELKLLAQIPTVRSIRCEDVFHEPERMEISNLQIKELELINARVPLEDRWRNFFKSITALERLHYTHGAWLSVPCSIHIPRVIINCLLGSALKSLTVLILDDDDDYDDRPFPCSILKNFTRLAVLRCKWREIVPDYHRYPLLSEPENTSDQSISDHSQQPDPVLELTQRTSAPITLLAEILPPTLRHLTLNRYPQTELHHLEEYIVSDVCQLKTFYYQPDTRLDVLDTIRNDAIQALIVAKGIYFVDGCAIYTEKAAPESWVNY